VTLLSHRDMYAGKFGLPVSARFQHSEYEIRRAVEEVCQQHPELAESEAQGRALARLDAQKHALQPKAIVTKRHNWRRWAQVAVFVALLLAVIVLSSLRACAQIDVIKWQNQGSGIGVFAAPFTVNFTGAGVVCSRLNSVVTCTVTGGSITNNPGGSNTNVQYNNSGAFGGIANGTLGQVLISQGAGSTPAFADPLVQGTQAAASTTIPNPVVIGGSDYGGTPAVQTAKVTSAGALQTHETGTAAISAASLPLPTGAALDSSLTTIDTDVKANITLHAGTNVIGHVIADSGSTTAVTGNVAVTKADGSDVTLGAKGDAKNAATDTTAISAMSVLKQISASVQAPPSQAVTNAGTFAVQAAATIADGADTTLGAKGDAKSTATDTTAVSAISVLKEISALEQAPASRAVTNAGTFAVQIPANSSVNVAQVAGTTTDTNSGTKSAGTLRVVLATDQPALTNKLLVTPDSVALPANQSVNLNQVAGAATSATNPLYIRETDGTNPVILDPCRTQANIFKPISQTASAQLVTGTSAKKIYICSINLVTAAANNVAMVEGTGTVCATGIAGMAGGTTAATGWNFSANGGLTQGNGMGSIMAEATNADNLCLLQSAAVQLSGVIGYVVQ
jgi:hypothetical protein